MVPSMRPPTLANRKTEAAARPRGSLRKIIIEI
jgi:hypothetical protein